MLRRGRCGLPSELQLSVGVDPAALAAINFPPALPWIFSHYKDAWGPIGPFEVAVRAVLHHRPLHRVNPAPLPILQLLHVVKDGHQDPFERSCELLAYSPAGNGLNGRHTRRTAMSAAGTSRRARKVAAKRRRKTRTSESPSVRPERAHMVPRVLGQADFNLTFLELGRRLSSMATEPAIVYAQFDALRRE